MKLYIPTSSLNFNNILSSESISPKAFYAQREFGYLRWTEIPENGLDNAIILYERPFSFTRPDSDLEDHPMLIEICTDEDLPTFADGVFYADHTIYLSPWKTRFIFFSEQDKRVALSISESSLETKLVNVYKSVMTVESYNAMERLPDKLPNIKLNANAIDFDCRINKMKGLLYGYYIGALLSESPVTVKRCNILQELQNIFSAIASSEDKELILLQKEERLNVLLTELQKRLPAITYLQSMLANPQKIDEVINQCIRIGVTFPGMIDKRNIIESLSRGLEHNNFAFNWLKTEWSAMKRQIWQERKPLQVASEEIVVTDCTLSKISNEMVSDAKEKELIKAWVNEVLLSREYSGKINSFKKELSDKITVKAKDVYGEQWEQSSKKKVLNQMRRYVQGQESFQWHDYLTSSIAAVITKGESWDKLLAFMQSKEMFDYRLAFAFYGELCGFANLTRDFTDNLYNLDDRKYVATVYKEVYGQLLGVNPECNKNERTVIESKNMPYETLHQKDSPNRKLWKAWQEIKEMKGIKKKDELERNVKQVLEESGDEENIQSLLKKLDENIWKRGNKPMEELLRLLGMVNVPQVRGNNSKYERPLPLHFEENSVAKYFYNDNAAWRVIEDLVPDDAKNELKKDLRWFQEDELQKPRNERQYYGKINEKDNVQAINTFCNLKKDKVPYFPDELREHIRKRLIDHYVNK